MIASINHISQDMILGVWKITEELDSLKSQFSEEELAKIKHYHPHKQAEFTASRLLIKAMCKFANVPYHGLYKDEHGKPFIQNSTYHMSLSHSYPMVVGMMHKSQACGIDIERPREQLLKIKQKFLNKNELDRCADDIEKLCLHWSAKEAIYKIFGRKNLSFLSHISILSVEDELLTAQVKVGESVKTIRLFFEKMERYLLVYGYGTL